MRSGTDELAIIDMEHDWVCVRLRGEIDLASAPILRTLTAEAFRTPEAAGVVIDLAGCAFMDSTGLNALVAAKHAAEATGRPLRITGAHGIVRRVMQLTELDAVLPLAD
jgi:anti-sigma B factor antagonist